jgi:hypothetical protein
MMSAASPSGPPVDPPTAQDDPGVRQLHFALVGNRDYVRATDVLRRMIELRPDREITLRFVRPLTGTAELSHDRPPVPAVFINAEGEELFLSNADRAAPPPRIEANRNRLRGLRLRIGPVHLLAFASGGSIADRIERCFDLVHPGLGNVFTVRNIRVFAGRARQSRVLWFRIVQHPSRQQARLTMRTARGVVAEIGFRITPRRVTGQSIAPESPIPEGSARSSSETADADRRDPSGS